MAELQTAIFAGGCFWCTDAAYQQLKGVAQVEPGFTGGDVPSPDYYDVYRGITGHAEATRITFDPEVISYQQLLDVFWIIHNPTTLNRQGNDVGTAYRSAIFYLSEEQKHVAEASMQAVAKLWPDPIVTELTPAKEFWPADDEHKDYFKKHPEQGYCQVIINPKLVKLREQFKELLA